MLTCSVKWPHWILTLSLVWICTIGKGPMSTPILMISTLSYNHGQHTLHSLHHWHHWPTIIACTVSRIHDDCTITMGLRWSLPINLAESILSSILHRHSKAAFECGFFAQIVLYWIPIWLNNMAQCYLISIPLSLKIYLGWEKQLNNDL